MTTSSIRRAARLLSEADAVLAFVGSGLSQESGIPTFRGKSGLYTDADFQRFVTREGFEEDPAGALRSYQMLRDHILSVEPNPGHYALARMTAHVDFGIATQNVDYLLERACQRERVDCTIWHLHGSLFDLHCHDCKTPYPDATDVDLGTLDRCEACGGVVRPDIVLFGEMLPADAMDEATAAAHEADVVLCLGTTGAVYPAAQIPRIARSRGAELIEVNPNETELTGLCGTVIRETTGRALPAIDRLWTSGDF